MLWYDHGRQACASYSLIGKNASATGQIYSGLRTWAKGMGGTAHLSMLGSTIEMTACDPGKAFKAPPSHALQAEEVAAGRNEGEVELEKRIGRSAAICFASQVTYRLGSQALGSGPLTSTQQQAVYAAARTCRLPGVGG